MTFTVSEKPGCVDLSFSATLENIDKAANETKKFLSKIHAEQYTFDVILVLREALSNAVLDGSRLDATKVVACTLRVQGGNIIMEIEDQGEGFDWRKRLGKLPSPSAESGRGLPIMKQYCEKVIFNDKGNKLTLEKNIKLNPDHKIPA